MHYLGILLIPVLGLYWLLSLRSATPKQRATGIRQSLLAAGLILLLMSPLALFDLKHDFANSRAFQKFFTDRQTTVNLNPGRSDRFLPVLYKVTDDLVLGTSGWQTEAVAIVLLGLSLLVWYQRRQQRLEFGLLLVWLGFSWLGLGVYKQHVYAHYFGFIFPAVYLLLGAMFAWFWQRHWLGKAVSVLALGLLLSLFIQQSPLKQEPNRQLARTRQAAESIVAAAGNQPFNFGLIAKQNYDESYRYFFENMNAPLVRGEDEITEQLFVICEDGDNCQPVGNPAYQIAIFGPALLEEEWRIDHLRLYKLVHNPEFALE